MLPTTFVGNQKQPLISRQHVVFVDGRLPKNVFGFFGDFADGENTSTRKVRRLTRFRACFGLVQIFLSSVLHNSCQ